MKFKNWFYLKFQIYHKQISLSLVMICSIFSCQNMIIAMHFDKDADQQEMLDYLIEEEAENLRQVLRESRLKMYYAQYPLHSVIMRGDIEAIKAALICLENPLEVDEEDDEGKTPLYVAAFYKNIEAIKLLIEMNAGPDKVLKNPKSKFLKKTIYKAINDLLRGNAVSDDTSIPISEASENVLKPDPGSKKKISGKGKINKKTIKKFLLHIGDDQHKGVLIFTGLIKKLINSNDIEGLRKLIGFEINLVELSLRDESVILYAINCAPRDDHAIVELLLSSMNRRFISEALLVNAYLTAKKKKNNNLMNVFANLITRYFPRGTLLKRCKRINVVKKKEEQ